MQNYIFINPDFFSFSWHLLNIAISWDKVGNIDAKQTGMLSSIQKGTARDNKNNIKIYLYGIPIINTSRGKLWWIRVPLGNVVAA